MNKKKDIVRQPKAAPAPDLNEDEIELALARNVTTEEIANPEATSRLTALVRSALGNEGHGPALANEAMLYVMDADAVKYVRDDDGSLWPFVEGDEFWRGPLRLTQEQTVEQARFYPDIGKLVWASPWDK